MLATLIPLALVIALSPLTIIPAVLVLQAPRPRPTGLAFLGGWLLGLVALTAGLRRGLRPARRLCTKARRPGYPGCALPSDWR